MIELPALVLWISNIHKVLVEAWIFGEQRSATEYLKLSWNWEQVAWPLATMSGCYLMLEFGGLLRGKRRLGKNPSHIAKAVSLHWFAQVVAVIVYSAGVACYYSIPPNGRLRSRLYPERFAAPPWAS